MYWRLINNDYNLNAFSKWEPYIQIRPIRCNIIIIFYAFKNVKLYTNMNKNTLTNLMSVMITQECQNKKQNDQNALIVSLFINKHALLHETCHMTRFTSNFPKFFFFVISLSCSFSLQPTHTYTYIHIYVLFGPPEIDY